MGVRVRGGVVREGGVREGRVREGGSGYIIMSQCVDGVWY